MIIECPYCESKVDGKVIGEHYSASFNEPFKALLLECPVCSNSLLGGQDLYQTGPDEEKWSDVTRLWPEPERYLNWVIPFIVRESLEEAKKCYTAKAYRACAVMCGRSLEGVCRVHSTKSDSLVGGLKELRDMKIIDERLFQWSDELRKSRNIGAHAREESVSKEDARDLLDFATAICDYVFVLSSKFEEFMQRKQKDTPTQPSAATDDIPDND